MSETSADWIRLSPQQQEVWNGTEQSDCLWALVGDHMIIVRFNSVPTVHERDGSIARRIIWHIDEKL